MFKHLLYIQLDNIASNIIDIDNFRFPLHKNIDTQIIMNIEHDKIISGLRDNIYKAMTLLKNCKSDEQIKEQEHK